MSTTSETGVSRYPKGLSVLFATEMWERFSFYTMIAMFALYMRDPRVRDSDGRLTTHRRFTRTT